MNSGYKIYTDILRERLLKEIRELKIYNESQFGFREGRSTIDAIYVLKNACQHWMEKKGKVYVAFLDLKAAFDNVDRGELLNILKEKNINEGLIAAVMSVYRETNNAVRVENKIAGEFWTKGEVRQGCKLSTEIFNIYINDLEKELSKVKAGGIVVGKG